MNKHRLWLLILILIASALRLTLLGEQSLWYDEGVTWLLSQMTLPELSQWTAADIQPPLYYLALWATIRLFGDSEWTLRFPSVLFNILTIPVLYVLARCIFLPASLRQRTSTSWLPNLFVPLLATTLFVFSPLMVYYSQEARMYTLLVLEATLASYLLLRILAASYARPQPPTSYSQPPTPYSLLPTPFSLLLTPYSLLSITYALIATAALYTHYFAAFLLIAHALYLLFMLWRRHWPKTLIIRALVMFGLPAVFFLPWLPILLSRLGDDPSYWPGALKLNEALRKVLISFTTGETVFEQTGWWLALGYLGIFIAGGLFVIINRRASQSSPPPTSDHNHSSLLTPHYPKGTPSSLPKGHSVLTPHFSFLLLWLIIPIALILLLSYPSPKFNPRYTLLSYPAFILLLTAALAQLLPTRYVPRGQRHASATPPKARKRHAPRTTYHGLRIIFLTLSLLFIFSTYAFGLYNWFADPRFSKDDFQALAQFVRERQASDETVLLSSGHMFPVWAYYYGWGNWTPLPQMERLDVNRVTGLSIAAEIAPAVAGRGGVWLVTWQDEVIDPNGVVPFWLDRIGKRPLDAGDFWGVGLEHWRLAPDRMDLLYEDPIQQATQPYNFANQVDLLGMTQLNDSEVALFWRPRQPLPIDLILTLDLTDAAGFDWDRETVMGRPGAYLYPPSRWPVGQVVMTRHPLPWQPGTPPGSYLVEIGLGRADPAGDNAFSGWDVLDEQGRPQRRTALLGPATLDQLIAVDNLPPGVEPLVDLSPLLVIHNGALSPQTAEPGDRVLLALLWQAGSENQNDQAIAFELTDAHQQTFPLSDDTTPSRDFALSRWQPDDIVLGQYWLDLPPDATAGPATVQLRLINPANGGERIFPLAHLEIRPTERTFTPPEAVDMPLQADFSGHTTFLGADCSTWTGSACRATPGESVTLTLYWRSDAPLEKNYTVFTHLLGPAETILVNADHAPPKPTQTWVTGEIITDPVTLTIPADAAPGTYLIEVGLYDAADPAYERLPLTNGDTRLILPQPLIVE